MSSTDSALAEYQSIVYGNDQLLLRNNNPSLIITKTDNKNKQQEDKIYDSLSDLSDIPWQISKPNQLSHTSTCNNYYESLYQYVGDDDFYDWDDFSQDTDEEFDDIILKPLEDIAKLTLQYLVYGYITQCKLYVNVTTNIPKCICDIICTYTRFKPNSLGYIPPLGHKIKTIKGETATIYYHGYVHFHPEEVIGLQLDVWSPFAGNGIVHGKKYFGCIDGRAIWMPKSVAIHRIIQDLGQGTETRNKTNPVSRNSKQYDTYGNLKQLLMVNGYIRSAENTLNIEIPMDITQLIYIYIRIVPLKEYPRINDRVKTLKGRSGIVKYVGMSRWSELVIGLELETFDPNAHDGRIYGQRYFSTPEGRGYFTTLLRLVENNGPRPVFDENHMIWRSANWSNDYTMDVGVFDPVFVWSPQASFMTVSEMKCIRSNKMKRDQMIKIRTKLKRIEMLKLKQKNGKVLNYKQKQKITQQQELIKKWKDITNHK
eukprot:319917_1